MSRNTRSEQNASIYRAALSWKEDCLIGDWCYCIHITMG